MASDELFLYVRSERLESESCIGLRGRAGSLRVVLSKRAAGCERLLGCSKSFGRSTSCVAGDERRDGGRF